MTVFDQLTACCLLGLLPGAGAYGAYVACALPTACRVSTTHPRYGYRLHRVSHLSTFDFIYFYSGSLPIFPGEVTSYAASQIAAHRLDFLHFSPSSSALIIFDPNLAQQETAWSRARFASIRLNIAVALLIDCLLRSLLKW